MKFLSTQTIRHLSALLGLVLLPLSFGQIAEQKLESIFERLNGDDFSARYAARIELHDEVSQATAPGNESQRALVEEQLLARLASEELLTTKLWLLRQLEAIGSETALPALEALTKSDDVELANGARMAIERIAPPAKATMVTEVTKSKSELAQLARSSSNSAERSEAYSQLVLKDPKLAFEVLLETDDSASDFFRVAMTSMNKGLQKKTFALLPTVSVDKQIVIIGSLPRQTSAKYETALLALLGSENETLELQTIEALGRVGSIKSLDALLARIDSKSRDARDAATDALAEIADKRIDAKLNKVVVNGSLEERIQSLNALSLRASPGVNNLVNQFAADTDLDPKLREVAIEAMELVGDVDSFAVLVQIVIADSDAGLSRDAQKTLKRMSLRLADPEAAWAAFKDGFEATASNLDKRLALMLVSDSAADKGTIDYLKASWDEGDAAVRKMVLRVLPTWRNWDGGYALLELADAAGEDASLREQCFKGIGRLIFISDAKYPMDIKFELTAKALESAKTPEERLAVIEGFRNSTWRERVHVTYNEVDADLKKAVLEYAKD